MQISDNTSNDSVKSVNDYIELIKKVARIELSRLSMSSYIVDYMELVNIGATAVHVVLTTHPAARHNDSYFSTAIKWAIRNEMRRRYKWYSCKYLVDEKEGDESEHATVREAVYKTICSVEGMAEADVPLEIKDSALTPDQGVEFQELSMALKEAIKTLPDKEKAVLEARFYDNKRVKDIAIDLNVTSSRVTRIIQSGLDKVKKQLKKQDFI